MTVTLALGSVVLNVPRKAACSSTAALLGSQTYGVVSVANVVIALMRRTTFDESSRTIICESDGEVVPAGAELWCGDWYIITIGAANKRSRSGLG